ncbi:ABC transporter permease [Nonomuraea jiangxiensis]|uniref:ABC-2 type transport system permease protein/oleandomycin transport system permease protein n=1 Tax=Nonomuraea jiangxiensis TaxID=633440 RepID=A0A1G9LGR7_9ACTN|nr:ABC transporter permease [Nonomuraea jiangxiensis]SDL61017.1 ABC-2 type transport system permease protein/oleandomycin transport system permease protein [Nonomuraea jiangxiensis]
MTASTGTVPATGAAPSSEAGLANLFGQGLLLAGRNIRLTSAADTVSTMVVFPVIFVFGFLALFGNLLRTHGVDYAQFLPPAIVVQWMFSVAIGAAFAFAADRRSGMLARYRSLAISRGAVVVGRMAADSLRALLAIAVIVATGYVAGFRFQAGPLAALGFVALAVAFALAVSAGTSALGLVSRDPETVSATLHVLYLPPLMVSSAFVPADAFPAWIEPFVRHQPVTAVLDALRALAEGGPTAGPVLKAVVWLAGLLAVFSIAAVQAFRRAT